MYYSAPEDVDEPDDSPDEGDSLADDIDVSPLHTLSEDSSATTAIRVTDTESSGTVKDVDDAPSHPSRFLLPRPCGVSFSRPSCLGM